MVAQSRSLVVEFTGARGVGKSTFANLVRSALRNRGIEFDLLRPLSRSQRFASKIAGLPTNWTASRIWSRWQPASVEKLRIYQRRLRFYRHRMWRFSIGSGIYILDEGIVQLMMMLHAGTKQKDMRVIFETMGSLVRFPDVVISVVAPMEAVESRRKLRGNAGDLLKPHVSPRGRDALLSVQNELKRFSEANADLQLIVVENLSYEGLTTSAEAVADVLVARCEPIMPAFGAAQPDGAALLSAGGQD